MKPPSISLCMIVKDEEDMIARSLQSAAPLVDEIVIVDTGSTDGTITLAKQFTDRIYHFSWNDSFAEARNFALNQVKGEWVLWLDADEEIDLENEKLWWQSFLTKAKHFDALLLRLRNYYGSVVNEMQVYLYRSFRLLRAGAGLRYKQSIHEYLDLTGNDVRLDSDPVSGISIRHYGYLDPLVEKKRKNARNLRLLEKERATPDYDPWIDYHIASEWYRQRDYIRAFEHVNHAIRRFLANGQLPPALAYKLKYEILLVAGQSEKALEGIEHAIMLYPDYVDLHYYKGLFQFLNARYDEAIRTFMKCIEIGENSHYLVLQGTGSYMATYMIARSLEALGMTNQAMAVYEQLSRQYPDFKPPAREEP